MEECQIRLAVAPDWWKRLVGIAPLGDLAAHTGNGRQAGKTLGRVFQLQCGNEYEGSQGQETCIF